MSFPILLSVNDWRKKVQGNFIDNHLEQLLKNIHDANTIYIRVDKLIELLNYTDKKKSQDKSYQELTTSILAVISLIINEDDEVKIREKIKAREDIREFDPFYMPWLRPNPSDVSNDPYALYQTVKEKTHAEINDAFKTFYNNIAGSKNLLKIGGRGKNSDDNFWAYRTESHVEETSYNIEELEQFRVIPYQGKLIKLITIGSAENRQLSFEYASTNHLAIKAYDDLLHTSKDYSKRGIYTVHINGSIFVGPSLAPKRTLIFFNSKAIQHPSYSDSYSGISLFMAGQAEIVLGESAMIDSGSGHYLPDYNQTQQAHLFFKELGIISNHTQITYYRLKEQKRTFEADRNSTELAALIKDFLYEEEIDSDILTPSYLSKKYPALYTHYAMQTKINNEFELWQKESHVFFTSSSLHTIKLNQAVEKFSKYGRYDNPKGTLLLLLNIQKTVDAWNSFHQNSKVSSRRQDAVNHLEERVQKQMLYYSVKQLFHNLKDVTMPKNYQTIVIQFLNGIIDIEKFTAEISILEDGGSTLKAHNPTGTDFELVEGSTIKSRPVDTFKSHHFFPSIKQENPLILTICELIMKSKNASMGELKEINKSLYDLITSSDPAKQISLESPYLQTL